MAGPTSSTVCPASTIGPRMRTGSWVHRRSGDSSRRPTHQGARDAFRSGSTPCTRSNATSATTRSRRARARPPCGLQQAELGVVDLQQGLHAERVAVLGHAQQASGPARPCPRARSRRPRASSTALSAVRTSRAIRSRSCASSISSVRRSLRACATLPRVRRPSKIGNDTATLALQYGPSTLVSSISYARCP